MNDVLPDTCPSCRGPLDSTARFCGRCGYRRPDEPPARALAPPSATEVRPPAAAVAGARAAAVAAPGRSRRPIAVAGGAIVVAALVAAGVLLLGGGGKEKPARAEASRLPTLPAKDVVTAPSDTMLAQLPRLSHAVLVAAGGRAGERNGDGVPHAVVVTRDTPAVVCGAVRRQWVESLATVFLEDIDREATLKPNIGKGDCAWSGVTRVHTEGADVTYPADVIVRGVLGDAPKRPGIVPGDVPAFRGAYTEVQIAAAAPADGSAVTADGVAPELAEKEVVSRIATIVRYSGRGRLTSADLDFAAATRNRLQTLARVRSLRRRTDRLDGVLERLEAAARASLRAVEAYEECGGLNCADGPSLAATEAKTAFVDAFNPYASRYLHRSYRWSDL
jgi:hypothetical protein